ncbi:MAG: GNAT family N-acetyltransferase [Pseudomonadota bacterium]
MTDPVTLAARHARAFTSTMRPWRAEEFEGLLASPHTHLIDSGHAFALTRVIADEAELLTLATDPAHRRKGLARAVLQELETHAKAKGTTTLFLEVSAENTSAIALYTSAGYKETARRPNYYQTPDGHRLDALIMSKAL